VNDSVELKLARVVTGTLILVGLTTSLLGVVALVRWVF
jgi:hypothetical protein